MTVSKPKFFFRIFLLCLVLFFPAILINYFLRSSAQPLDLAPKLFKTESFLKNKFDVVFLGNSMLDSRISADTVKKLTKQSAFVFSIGGSEFPLWYLFFENYVLQKKVKPKTIVVFFRVGELEFNREHLSDDFYNVASYLQSKTKSQYFNDKLRFVLGTQEYYLIQLQDLIGVTDFRKVWAQWRSKINELIFQFFPGNTNTNTAMRTIESYFSYQNMIPSAMDAVVSKESPVYSFQESLDYSLIPRFLELAQSNGIKVYFYRIQKNPHSNPYSPVEQKIDREYMKPFAAYLKSHSVTLLDDSKSQDAELSKYSSGDHIASHNKEWFTKLFVTKYPEIFR